MIGKRGNAPFGIRTRQRFWTLTTKYDYTRNANR